MSIDMHVHGAWRRTGRIVPLRIGVALLCYQRWEIDAIISKTLIYGLLTALLGALYVGLIMGLERLMSLMSGQVTNEPVALVVSTLVIAALLLPVRRSIQALIDWRFYRRKYDAEQTLAAFSAALRNEVDLEQIGEELVAVVQQTMQPAYVSLWLSPTAPERKNQSPWCSTPSAP